MNRNVLRLLALGLALSAGAVSATEIRSPLMCEQGPLRHILQKEGNKESSEWETWSSGYRREAHTAFKEHGVKTQSLASLVFNKDNFKMSEIFPNCKVPLVSQNYNPFLRTARLVPNIRYSEQGFAVGAQWSTEGFGGRWGVRGSISFRSIEQESLQDIYGNGTRVEDLKITTLPRVLDVVGGVAQGVGLHQQEGVTALRYDLAEAAFQDSTRKSYITADPYPWNATIATGNPPIEFQLAGNSEMTLDPSGGAADTFDYAIVYSPGLPPRPPAIGGFMNKANEQEVRDQFQPLPLTASDLQGGNVMYYIPRNGAAAGTLSLAPYLNFIMPEFSTSPVQDLAYQEMKENLWLVQSIDRPAGGGAPGEGANAPSLLETDYNRYVQESLVVGLEDWLEERGCKFEDARRAGMGDTPIEAFYQYNFAEELMGELVLGVRIPTGTSANYESNPLLVKTGNGGHTELKFGAMLVWQAWEKISIKADLSYSLALKAREQLSASFVGANIKNIGPRADADVSWGYLVGHLDFNFMHPQTDSYNCVIGYELYLKGKNTVKFRQAAVESWLGGTIDTTSITQGGGPAAVGNEPVNGTYSVSANPQALNNALAAQNTNSIGHKIRFESSIRFNEWVEASLGGSFTFAGQNLPRETDAHAGLHLNF